MKTIRKLSLVPVLLALMISGSSCRVWHNTFRPKSGCPANGKAFGAERILSGEKIPKTKKFRV